MKAIKFQDLEFEDISKTHGEDAIQTYLEFENGYDISVVKHKYSYGGKKGMYEVGCFYNNHMVDPADWGDTVKGWLNESDVEHWLNYIKRL